MIDDQGGEHAATRAGAQADVLHGTGAHHAATTRRCRRTGGRWRRGCGSQRTSSSARSSSSSGTCRLPEVLTFQSDSNDNSKPTSLRQALGTRGAETASNWREMDDVSDPAGGLRSRGRADPAEPPRIPAGPAWEGAAAGTLVRWRRIWWSEKDGRRVGGDGILWVRLAEDGTLEGSAEAVEWARARWMLPDLPNAEVEPGTERPDLIVAGSELIDCRRRGRRLRLSRLRRPALARRVSDLDAVGPGPARRPAALGDVGARADPKLPGIPEGGRLDG